jgi:uncharacterized membrane protein (DUF4010 family)
VVTFKEMVLSLAVAVAAGTLVGAEREQAASGREGAEFGGIRTFPLVALLGALGALCRPALGLWLLVGLLVGVIAFVTVSHMRSAARDEIGVSSEVAALATFALGAMAATPELLPGHGRFLIVGAVASAVLALLALKRPLHGFAANLSGEDIYATVRFVALGLIVLPVLPEQAYGPLGVLVPYKIGKMIVLVAAVSFAGYVAARVVGSARGLLVAGLLGGLVSSTAVTMTYSGRARKDPALAAVCAVAIVAACSMMFARLVVVVAAVDRPLLGSLAPPLGAMAVVGFGAAWWLYRGHARKGSEGGEGEGLRNPFELGQAISFGALYGGVLLVAKAAQTYLGNNGLYASAVLAGLTDVDAITLSATDLHRGGLSADAASTVIVLAAVTNTMVKAGIALSSGGAAVGRRVAGVLGAALASGSVVLLLLRMR